MTMAKDLHKQGITGTARFDTSDQQKVGESEYGGVGGNRVPTAKGESARPGYETLTSNVQTNPAEESGV